MDRDDGVDLFREESPRVEWKESHRAKDLLDAVCAFANDLDGRGLESFVVIGVDKRGRPTGAYHHGAQADEVQQHLANLLSSTKILPHPDVQIEPIEHEGALVFVLRVRPYAVPPVVKVDGTPWIRAGTVTRRANDGELRRLEERRPPHQQPFDTRPCAGATFDDVDLGLLQAKYRADREVDGDPETFLDFQRWLRQRGLLALVDGAWALNNAAILSYGLSPQDFLPGAFIDVTVYQGDDFDSPILARGIRRARKVLTSHGFPPLEVETNGFTTITVRRRP